MYWDNGFSPKDYTQTTRFGKINEVFGKNEQDLQCPFMHGQGIANTIMSPSQPAIIGSITS